MGYTSCAEATTHESSPDRSRCPDLIAIWKKDSVLANMTTNPAATSGWSILYSPSMPPSLSQNADGSYYVDLPHQDGLHYVVQGAQGNPTGKTIIIKFELVGTAELLASDPGETCPCSVSLYLQQQGDTLRVADEFKRWWLHKIPLNAQGEALVVVSPENFTQVFGKRGSDFPRQFQAAMSSLANVGFTFGGTSFAGHGIYVKQGTGSVRFVLKEYSIK
jgi:hypothetical protein